MAEKVCVITGANSGVGKAASIQIDSKGCRVVMACRNPESGDAARKEVVRESGGIRVDLELVNMSSQVSIKSRFSISPEKMAETYTYLALSEDVSKVTGTCFDSSDIIVSSSEYSLQKENIDNVMKLKRGCF